MSHRILEIGERFQFVFVNGSRITGKVLAVHGEFVVIKAEGRRVKVNLENVLTITRVERRRHCRCRRRREEEEAVLGIMDRKRCRRREEEAVLGIMDRKRCRI